MKYRITIVTCLLVLGISPNSQAVTLGEIINPLEDFLDCNTNDSAIQIICNDIQEIVNRELAQANLELQNGGLLYTQTENGKRVLEGGCTSRTELTSLTAQVKLRSSTSLNLSGNAISQPAMFMAELPVQASVNARLKTRYGLRFFGGCSQGATDSFRVSGNAYGNAKVGVLLSLEPKFINSPSLGQYIIQIKPIVNVSASVDARVTNVRLRGANPILGLLGTITGFASGLLQSAEENILGSGNFERAYNSIPEESLRDIGLGLVFTFLGGLEEVQNLNGNFDGVLSSFFLTPIANNLAQEAIEDQNLEQVERDLEADIKRALKLDENGERFFVFSHTLLPKKPLEIHRWALKRVKYDYERTRDCNIEWESRYVTVPKYLSGSGRPQRINVPIEVCGDYYWKIISPPRPKDFWAPL